MTYKEHMQVLETCNKQLDKTLESSEEVKRLFPLSTAIFQKTSDIEDEESPCCGVGTYGDNKICEDCGEHC